MIFKEELGDLFELDNSEYVLAHCISADFALGLGIAKTFDTIYDMKVKLNLKYTKNGVVPSCLKIDNVYNLVTKSLYWQKPTYKTLMGSLEFLKEQMLSAGEKKLGIPTIGCNLDKLDWGRVKEIIQDVFKDTDIEITVRIK